MPQDAGHAEVECTVAESPVEGDGGVAQRAIRDRDRYVVETVVDDLMPNEDGQRISTDLALDVDHVDLLLVIQPLVAAGNVLEHRDVDGGNPILTRSAGENLTQRYRTFSKNRSSSLPWRSGRAGAPRRRQGQASASRWATASRRGWELQSEASGRGSSENGICSGCGGSRVVGRTCAGNTQGSQKQQEHSEGEGYYSEAIRRVPVGR